MDSTVQAFCHYQRCALFLAILFPLEASEDLVPVNTSGAQHIVCKVWGWKIEGRKREACMHSLSLLLLGNPGLSSMKLEVNPTICVCRETSPMDHMPLDTTLVEIPFTASGIPALAAILAQEASEAFGAEVVTTTVLTPSRRAADSARAGNPSSGRRATLGGRIFSELCRDVSLFSTFDFFS